MSSTSQMSSTALPRMAHDDFVHHIRISTDGEINVAVKFEELVLHKADI